MQAIQASPPPFRCPALPHCLTAASSCMSRALAPATPSGTQPPPTPYHTRHIRSAGRLKPGPNGRPSRALRSRRASPFSARLKNTAPHYSLAAAFNAAVAPRAEPPDCPAGISPGSLLSATSHPVAPLPCRRPNRACRQAYHRTHIDPRPHSRDAPPRAIVTPPRAATPGWPRVVPLCCAGPSRTAVTLTVL